MTRLNYLILMVIITFPFLFDALSQIDHSFGLFWLFIHQLYYQPLAGLLQEPFFTYDGDIGFLVKLPGRILTPVLYITLFFIYKLARKKSI